MSRRWRPSSPWQWRDGVALGATLLTTVVVAFFYLVSSYEQTRASKTQTELNAWSERMKELRVLYPQYLEAGSGNRPLIDSSTYTRFDNLRLLCAPFTRTPTRRVADYLVQMAQSARFLRNGWGELAPDYRTCFPLVERLVQLELAYPPSGEESLSPWSASSGTILYRTSPLEDSRG